MPMPMPMPMATPAVAVALPWRWPCRGGGPAVAESPGIPGVVSHFPVQFQGNFSALLTNQHSIITGEKSQRQRRLVDSSEYLPPLNRKK